MTQKTSAVMQSIACSFYEKPYVSETNENSDFTISDGLINKSIQNICYMWNESDKSQKFIKHIISAFIPHKAWNKLSSTKAEDIKNKKIVCCITGVKLTGLLDFAHTIAPIKTKLVFVNARKCVAKTDNKQEEIDSINIEFENIQKEIDSMPDEMRFGRVAQISENSDKYMSQEACIALTLIMQECIMRDEPTINFILRKMRISQFNSEQPKEKRLTNKQINKTTRAIAFNNNSCIDDETRTKLEQLKNQ